MAGRHKGGVQVDRHHEIVIREGDVQPAEGPHRGVVDQEIKTTELGDSSLDHGRHLGSIGEIDGHTDRPAPGLPDSLDHVVERALHLSCGCSRVERAAQATAYPSPASASAVAAPMPRLAPVTRATFSVIFRHAAIIPADGPSRCRWPADRGVPRATEWAAGRRPLSPAPACR